ncbi:hypothetical protein B296_00011030 [Ensete ventricosum]|uniref:Uncharacterized protein n=1 Tax=Ensete ventricosum TaxID=4639 RepID=A0A426XXM2_ENSVE|nr:hypothetical protein B296_00011030 [Ensete ventricosum]
MKKSYSEFITRESVCNGDVTRRRYGAADHGEIVRGNATQAIVSREGQDHEEMIRSYWKLHFGRGLDYTKRRDFPGVIDPSLSWRESIGRKRGRGGEECKDKLQVPRQGGRTEAKELHKTSVDGLLIKIAESEGLQINAKVLDQGMK